MAKVIKTKNLSGLDGVKEVSFGDASPERRRQGDYSKSGVESKDHSSFDDHKDRQARWESQLGKL